MRESSIKATLNGKPVTNGIENENCLRNKLRIANIALTDTKQSMDTWNTVSSMDLWRSKVCELGNLGRSAKRERRLEELEYGDCGFSFGV